MTPKLLGGKGIMASVITILVPCCALPRSAGQALVCNSQSRLPLLLSLPAPQSRGSATCIYCTYQQLGGTGIKLHFLYPPTVEVVFLPAKQMALPKSMESLGIRRGVGKGGSFAGVEGAVATGWRCFPRPVPFSAVVCPWNDTSHRSGHLIRKKRERERHSSPPPI